MPTVTLLDLKNRCYARLDDNTLLYTGTEVRDALNECLRVVNLATGILQVTVQVPGFSVVNQVWYNVPAGVLIPLRVQFEGNYLQKYSANTIGLSYPLWVKETTQNTGLPIAEWVPCGISKFAIHPADSIGGGDIRVTGIAEPTLLSSDSDVVSLPNEYTDTIVLLASMTLQLKETGALFSQASLVLNEYFRIIKKLTLWRTWVQPRYWVDEAREAK